MNATIHTLREPKGITRVGGVMVIVKAIPDNAYQVILQGNGDNHEYPVQINPLFYVFTTNASGRVYNTGKSVSIPQGERYVSFEAEEIERTERGHSENGCYITKLFMTHTMNGKETRAMVLAGGWMRRSDYKRHKDTLRKYTDAIWYPPSGSLKLE